ncbi:hypothetical protein [Arenibaculum pallidiluteum]|uniref:hypothetical protein n=1 Tax=Arenibaculum pallidiluteum TaxID=2812559 RepID=UPI001A973C48|nr:hypothetical protein [Arenibaculum pallidiluteum]
MKGRSAVLLSSVLVTGVALWYAASMSGTAVAMDKSLEGMGFFPLRPPTTLVGPGSIYHVSRDGKFYRTVCKADQSRVTKAIERSPSEKVIAQQLSNGKISLGASVTELVRAGIGNTAIQSVSYSLSDVAVLEIPLNKNEEIFVALTSEPSCRSQVDHLLRNGELVCQGQTALVASVDYQIQTSSRTDVQAELDQEQLMKVKGILQESVGAEVEVQSGRIRSGVGLHYGIKVNPFCVTRPEDRFPRRIPQHYGHRILNYVQINLLGG